VTRPVTERRDLGVVVAAFVATVLWSCGNLLVRSSTVPGPQLAFFRVCIGCAAYSLIVTLRGNRPTWRTIRTSALGGIGFGLQASLYFTALKMTTLASATVIASLQPVMLLPVSASLYGERIDRRRVTLVLVALGGTVLVVAGSTSSGSWSLGGDLLALLATALGCLYFIGTKAAREHLGTFEYQSAALAVAAVCTLPGALFLGDGFAWPVGAQWLWPVAMTAVAGSGHLLMSWAQRHLSVSFTSTVSLDVLPLTVLGGAIFLGQSVSAIQLVGMAVVLGSLMSFVSTSRAVAEPPEPVS